jgi:hypothetical protein
MKRAIISGFLAAGLLASLVTAVRPQIASADDVTAPHITGVKIDTDSTGYVTFEDPNGDETGYDIWMLPQSSAGRGFQISTPGVPGSYRIVTRTVAGLTPGVSYCFVVDAVSDSDQSDFSNKACADPPAAQTPPAPAPKSTHTTGDLPLSAKIVDATELASIQSTVPSQPDLVLTDIRPEGNAALTNGATAVYDVVVANTGAKLPGSGEVQVQIQVNGSVSFVSVARTPAGFSCSGTSVIVCTGPLGGYGDPPITTSVIIGVQVHADRSGVGSLSAAADPNNVIEESDEANNARTLPISVK